MTYHCCPAQIGPSVLDCDLACLADEGKRALAAGASYLHLDVMDGHFVPNISFGPYVVECLRKHLPDTHFDIHMMTTHPEKWIEPIAKAKAQSSDDKSLLCFTFHYEATEPRGITQEVIDKIKSLGMQVGLTVSPDTPVEGILKYAHDIDLALVMTVYPGKGGQSFLEGCMSKVKTLREKHPNLDIEVDGGVKPQTIDMAAKAGANLIVSGSGVYKAKDMAHNISVMQRSVETYGNGKTQENLSEMRSDFD